MEYIGYFFMFLVFIYVLDTNSKVKTLYRKIYLEDENEKGNTFRILNQNIGKTIKVNIKENYAEYGRLDEGTLDTLDENQVKVIALNKDWVHIELYEKQTTQKLIRLESISSVNVG